MKASKIFWGSLIFTIGVLLLLYNLDMFNVSPSGILKYWPLLLIVWGITFFKLPNFLKASLSFVSGVFLGILLTSFLNYNIIKNVEYKITKSFGDRSVILDSEIDSSSVNNFKIDYNQDFETADFKLNAGSGVFKFTEISDKLIEIETNDNNPKFKSDVVDSSKVYIKYDYDDFKNTDIKSGSFYRVKMHPNPVWNLKLDIGSPKLEMDLTSLKVRNLLIDAGAADISVKLGEFYEETFVDLDLGVSNVHILVPESSAVTINSSSAISSYDYKNFDNLTELSENKHRTDNWDTAEKRINIKIDSGISKVTIETYK